MGKSAHNITLHLFISFTAMASKPVLESLPGIQKWPEEFKDVTVFCGSETFKLHKAIFCSNSQYFTKALCGGFEDAENSEIELASEDSETFERLVQFCYSGTYLDCATKFEQESQNHGFGAHYLSPAELFAKYQSLPGLLGAAGPSLPKAKTEVGAKSLREQDEITFPASPGAMAAIERSILIAGRVYIMAEMLLMPAAKVLALERFRAGVDDIINADLPGFAPTSELIELIDNLYTNLLDTDVAVKEPICLLIALKRLEPKFWDSVSPMMRNNGALAVGVTNYINLLIPSNIIVVRTPSKSSSQTQTSERSILQKPTAQMRQMWMEKERKQCG
ncbi:hypothetical protein MCOR25_001438 [Pyricularia grisea]|uniref:BTB domain-containing protein n=1 Tax=Pyricularia grisea TaxID=148305 RepID=A0A6P8AUE0_PYRGI|nr:uncharacterized protein PgNI_08704 [Pyricularia grisea]KAI6380912.1 hypothetical protein MCOR25_001438 [Pyricularia grisea]TLD05815.1 hypothetical protein PgNI_08704 [Pyricularia grisea]